MAICSDCTPVKISPAARSAEMRLQVVLRRTSICGLGQVALGPAISVLGLKRGGTEARPQPRPARAPDQTTPDSADADTSSDGVSGPDGDSS